MSLSTIKWNLSLRLFLLLLLFFNWSIIALQFCVLVSSLQRSESGICIHIPLPSSLLGFPLTHTPPRIPPIWVPTEHQAELRVLYRSFPPAVCFTHGSVFMFILIFPFRPCPHVHSLHLHLYSCPADRFIHTIFLDSTYMC